MICFLYFGMWESFLQRQSGVIFFTYMITFLFLYEPSFFKNKIENDTMKNFLLLVLILYIYLIFII